jgi:hypothetical protein
MSKPEIYLPQPTEDELTMTGKHSYFNRLLGEGMDLDKKYKIKQEELTAWIHHNYQSVFLLEKEISLNELKKLI